jgi:hypothetical protein
MPLADKIRAKNKGQPSSCAIVAAAASSMSFLVHIQLTGITAIPLSGKFFTLQEIDRNFL